MCGMTKQLARRQRLGNVRSLQCQEKLIDFSSNDYLGMARSQEFARRAMAKWEQAAVATRLLGATGSRLLTGNSSEAEQLEQEIAAFHDYETGTLFTCGYMANVGLLTSVIGDDDVIFFDFLVHASTRDGIRLSRAQAFPFRHQDPNHLESRLQQIKTKGKRWILVESIYSTNGAVAPLKEISWLGEKYDAELIVDEAHAVGVMGPLGKGVVYAQGLTKNVFAQVVTFGKALGCAGAIVLGSRVLKKMLVNFARSLIYTTALPFYSLAAIQCSYDLFPALDEERHQLGQLIAVCQRYFFSQTPIQPIPVRGNQLAQKVATKLADQGFAVRPLMSPTVQRGREMLRLCLHAFNTVNELEILLEVVRGYQRESHG